MKVAFNKYYSNIAGNTVFSVFTNLFLIGARYVIRSAIDIIRFKDIYEQMESCVDSLDYTGKVVRCMLVKMG